LFYQGISQSCDAPPNDLRHKLVFGNSSKEEVSFTVLESLEQAYGEQEIQGIAPLFGFGYNAFALLGGDLL
jgi:hypothetical protein